MNFKRVIRRSFIRALLGLACLLLALTVELPLGAQTAGATALRTSDFLDSIGTISAVSARGETLQKTIDCVTYLGVRWLRSGIEGNIPMQQFIDLHQKAGVRFDWGFGSGSSDLGKLLQTARQIEAAGALMAFEGPNEPNNWGINYQGQAGGRDSTWMPVAKLQSDLYQAVKSDPVFKDYPVWSISEGGAERDNVGLQFLTIPMGAETLPPAGTKFADDANVHNYIYHPNSPGVEDNKTWNAADPTSACKVDGLYGEYGLTWAHHYPGYSADELPTLPRVTTETGTTIGGGITEEMHALNLLSLYLDQFKRGWNHTSVYLLRDRVDEAGNQQFGFYRPDYTPRKAAVYLHNLTTILADRGSLAQPGRLGYSIPGEPATVHDLLLQRSDGAFQLVVWGERVKGTNTVTVNLADAWPSVRIYDPTLGITPVQTLNHTSLVPLALSDHPLLLEMAARVAQVP
jgi:hypothetical protein